ncbi:MAG: hypothetical protein K5978_06490 [Campylobacter sp.]|nr:hypothetical protein [Campylobacter sp.]
MDIFQFIGFCGMVCIVVAYFMLQLGNTNAKSLKFQFINLIGAILLIISLCVHFNLGSFMIEIFWIIITIFGIVKIIKGQKNEA